MEWFISIGKRRQKRAFPPSASTSKLTWGERRVAQRFPGFADTEGVTGPNPVAPTTVLAGQRAISAKRTALLTYRGRGAAAVCSPPNRMALSKLDDTDQYQLNDHGA